MLTVGLTGNIGSGKTMVARILNILGASVFYADEAAKTIINDEFILPLLLKRFGPRVLNQDKMIDRHILAQLLFTDPEALKYVNALIHPVVRKRFDDFCKGHAYTPCCIYEAAILIETGFYIQLDRIILVTAPEALRIQRVMHRDQAGEEHIRQRMKKQWSEDRKSAFAHYIICNDGSKPLLRQCLEVFGKMCGN